ncbi:transcriptional regulator [uncultured Sphingomonas sp.]|uniref:3'-5' exonuclease n=1 Tax=uncultured Sphingomonas sp. TaxID=158754 RepID=UPI0025D8C90C|nr:transcriptional regulator [uncultured Sphingomonas sp.]
MLVFLDFEASSLGKKGVPIEVAWVFEDGRSESHLIRPAPGWDDWDVEAEAIHHIPRDTLMQDGTPHDQLARHMVEALGGHDLLASAPSWDGKWLSALLRAAGLPRHSLRLRDSEEAFRDAARTGLRPTTPPDLIAGTADAIVAAVLARFRAMPPAHRALADAERERARWLSVRDMAAQE